MKIFVDADACPVVKVIEKVAEKYNLPCMLICDTSHVISSGYSEVTVVEKGIDSVDFKLIELLRKGDICVTQDYGVATLVLSKEGYAIHQSGKWFTNENIDQFLMERHLAAMERRRTKRYNLKRFPKRTKEDNMRFEQSFEMLINHAIDNDR